VEGSPHKRSGEVVADETSPPPHSGQAWKSDPQRYRVEMISGFKMPGFRGHYFMWPEEYALLSKYVDLTSGDYLEIGSMCGIIAMSFAECYPERHFVCVDKFASGHGTIAGEKQTFLQNREEHGLRNVELLEGDSLSVVAALSRDFELAFIDGNHAYDYVLGDALNCWRLLVPGGFLLFHDYGYVADTTRAVDSFLEQSHGEFLESASSLAVVQKTGNGVQDQPCWQRTGLRNNLRASHLKELRDAEREAVEVRRQLEELRLSRQQLESSRAWRLFSLYRRFRGKA
jgi:predicted O-methyltransferase YrrM